MRTADTILGVIRDRGELGLPLERVYRLLYNQELYLRAYANIYANDGAMTPGHTKETVDSMSVAKINKLIDNIRYERHKWTPVRRVNIPKKNGKMRPLGLPTWSDKLLQEVMRLILEAYYEPRFNDLSHGFRPNRGCHTALQHIQTTWTGTRWFIEGDIQKYFDTINHDKLIEILTEHIQDERFLRLIRELLEAGYMENWKFNATYSGTPQGGIISPLLSNIYLHRFDEWMTTELIPAYTRGDRRRGNPEYQRINYKLYTMRHKGDKDGVQELIQRRRALPSIDTKDANYRRLNYLRYADDFLLGFIGTKGEANEIKLKIQEWLRVNLDLSLSMEKTLITHGSTETARFLGYDILISHNNQVLHGTRRVLNGNVGLRVPTSVIESKCARYMANGKPVHRAELLMESDYTIVSLYQQEYRGLVQYYKLAHNIAWLHKVQWIMRTSLLKTLAHKHKSSVLKMVRKHITTINTTDGKSLHCIQTNQLW
jgi:group II intron reverse transcriptase/maturase